MKETIFSQRVNYAIIEKYKNYSHLSQKPKDMSIDIVGRVFETNHQPSFVDIVNLPPPEVRGKKLKQLFHFISPKKDGERLRVCRAPMGGMFLTQDSQKIGKALSDPFSNINIFTRENIITREGNVVKLVMDVYTKHKDFNHKFARKRINKVTIKFDFDKGNTLIMKQRGNHKEFRTNSLWFFDEIDFEYFKNLFPKSVNSRNQTLSKKHKDIEVLMNMGILILTLKAVCAQYIKFDEPTSKLNFFTKLNDHRERFTLKQISLLNLVKGKGIKVNNNYEDILINLYPTQKYLKRNGYKLIQSCLDRMGIKHSPCIKIAHNNFTHTWLILKIKTIVGNDYYRYISNVKWSHVTLDYDILVNGRMRYQVYGEIDENQPLKSKREKTNFIKILNEVITSDVMTNDSLTQFIGDIVDHIRIMDKISDINPYISLNACTYQTFMEEHRVYSKIERRMDRDSTILIEYDENFIDIMNEPFDMDGYTFKPVVLVNEDQYIDEGEEMNHCVAGYITNRNSIIVSLCETTTKERSTLEYDTLTGVLKQERSNYNKKPVDYLLRATRIMTERINSIQSSMRNGERKRMDRNGNYIDYIQEKKWGDFRGVQRFPIDF